MGPQGSVFEGKTLDEAVRKGLEMLGLTRAAAMITVVEEGSGGFLGFGSRPFKVRVMPRPGGAIHEADVREDDTRRSRDRSGRDRGARGGRDRGGRDRGGRGGRGRDDRGHDRGGRDAGRQPVEAAGGRPEAPRGDRPPRSDDRRPRDDRPRDDRPRDDRPRDDRPRDDRPRDDRPRGEDRRRGDDRPRGEERPRGEDRRRGDRPRMDDRMVAEPRDRAEAGERREENGRGPAPGRRAPEPAEMAPPTFAGDDSGVAGGEGEGREGRGRRRRRGRRGGAGRDRETTGGAPGVPPSPHTPLSTHNAMSGGTAVEEPVMSAAPPESFDSGDDAPPIETHSGPAMSNEALAAEGKRWTEQLLKAMGFEATVRSTADADRVNVTATVENDEQLLTGQKGEVRQALQQLLNRMINRGDSSRYHLQLEINDFWEKRETELRGLAERLANQAIDTDSEVITDYLNAQERRIIHVTLRDDARVKTYALGTGHIKRLAVAPAGHPGGESTEG